jgi:hypothetical protein
MISGHEFIGNYVIKTLQCQSKENLPATDIFAHFHMHSDIS